jgi:hypothetical protein
MARGLFAASKASFNLKTLYLAGISAQRRGCSVNAKFIKNLPKNRYAARDLLMAKIVIVTKSEMLPDA